MPKVTLARHWNPGTAMHLPGEVVEVDDTTADWLARTGALAPEQAVSQRPAAEKKPAQPAEVETPAEDPDDAEVVKRPARTAPVEEWRKYAQSLGYDVKGLTKQELIALQ
ncbi:hypothetical protein M3G47_01280 [Corynebacterium sanguinis]|uniref:hypothetical protein n=1 Tax=Corynebacterium sanguinis TaxID=2594913 RepID=UPI0021A49756|nr:hypothetical protein [Corynebacterium sanguinis]MCT1491348.1 hypothetical protein [Corynebacterium sanguinis]MCT2246733.1 hypothetical protein [Corynebacterium sanguinis]